MHCLWLLDALDSLGVRDGLGGVQLSQEQVEHTLVLVDGPSLETSSLTHGKGLVSKLISKLWSLHFVLKFRVVHLELVQ